METTPMANFATAYTGIERSRTAAAHSSKHNGPCQGLGFESEHEQTTRFKLWLLSLCSFPAYVHATRHSSRADDKLHFIVNALRSRQSNRAGDLPSCLP